MILEVPGAASAEFRAAVDILQEAFSPETLESVERLAAELEGSDGIRYRMLLAQKDGAAVGVGRFAWLPETQALFVVHLAVRPSFQGAGHGHALLGAIRATAPTAPVLLEIDPEESLVWWQRQGAAVLTHGYVQPALHAETAPVPLWLMRIGDVPDPIGTIRAFYREAWGLEPDAELVRRAVAEVRA